MVKITLGKSNEQIFAARYQHYLPTENKLIDELVRERREVEHQLSEKTDGE